VGQVSRLLQFELAVGDDVVVGVQPAASGLLSSLPSFLSTILSTKI
jgi:hypothetical protein